MIGSQLTFDFRKPQISSNKTLTLKFGSNSKDFPMYLISDSRPNEDDVKKYVNVQKTARARVLSKREASRMRRRQDDLVNNYTYTREDIEKNLRERKKTGKAAKNLGLEQTRAEIAVQGAESALAEARRRLEEAKRTLYEYDGHDAARLEQGVREAEEALEDAEKDLVDRRDEQKKLQGIVSSRKQKLTKRRKDVNWAKVNQRAIRMNQNADFGSYKEQQARKAAEAKAGGTPKFNPYARRKVKPKILWEVGQKEEKKDDDPKDNEGRDDVIEKPDGRETEQALKAAQAAQEAQKAALVSQSHQFTIDEQDLSHGNLGSLGISTKKRKISRVRKGLSLADYQQRKTPSAL